MKPFPVTFGWMPLVLAVSLPSIACVYDNDPPRRLAPEAPPAPVVAAGGSSSSSGTSSAGPLLVEIDADQTMNADPGDGVGVFVEYGKGGHWHVWWTCDTNRTQQSCEFSVSASATSGTIANVDAAELSGGFFTSPTPSRVDAKSTTTTQVHGLRFDTDPGAILTIDASIGSLKDGAFLFFVQDGTLKGGFKGQLTNPLQLQGNTP